MITTLNEFLIILTFSTIFIYIIFWLYFKTKPYILLFKEIIIITIIILLYIYIIIYFMNLIL